MRRLNLLLLLIILTCAASLATAEKPLTLVNGATIPDSMTQVIASSFPMAMRGIHFAGQALPDWLLPPWLGLPQPCLPYARAQADSGIAKAVTGLHFALHPPLGTLVPAHGFASASLEVRSWAAVGLRFQTASTRTLRRIVCRGHCKGRAIASTYELGPNPPGFGGEGPLMRCEFALYHNESNYYPLDNILPWARFRYPLETGPPVNAALLDGGVIWNGGSVDHVWNCGVVGTLPDPVVLAYQVADTGRCQGGASPYAKRFLGFPTSHITNVPIASLLTTSGPTPRFELVPSEGPHYVVLLLEVAFTPSGWCVFSDTDLDFYSGDYGAYFDSLEIELEPVKKPSKS